MKILKIMGLLLTAVVLTVACSKSDDDDDNGGNGGNGGGNGGGSGEVEREWKPIAESGLDFHIDFNGKDSRPDWQSPSPYDYETWMIYQVTLPLELREMASPNDLLAVFINGELRAVASPAISQWNGMDDYTYILKIFGNNEKSIRQSFVYKYYCENAHRIFEYHDIGHFIPEEILGVDEEYCLNGLLNELDDCYPVIYFLTLELPDDLKPDPEEVDYIVAFVGDECRGITKFSSQDEVKLRIFGREEGEVATLYYVSFGSYTVLKPTISLENGFDTVYLE